MQTPSPSVVTLETMTWALMANDGVLDKAGLSGIRGNHDGLWSLRLDGEGGLAVGLNQGVDRETVSLHRNALSVHLQRSKQSVIQQHFHASRRIWNGVSRVSTWIVGWAVGCG